MPWASLLGVLTLTPYRYWRRTHAIHHATSGNLDRRELGDVRDPHGGRIPLGSPVAADSPTGSTATRSCS